MTRFRSEGFWAGPPPEGPGVTFLRNDFGEVFAVTEPDGVAVKGGVEVEALYEACIRRLTRGRQPERGPAESDAEREVAWRVDRKRLVGLLREFHDLLAEQRVVPSAERVVVSPDAPVEVDL